MSDPQPTDNLNVIKDWKAGKNARNHMGTLRADGPILWSQHHKIGHRTEAGVCVVADLDLEDGSSSYELNTKVTLAHIELAKTFADTVFHQLVCESSPLFMKELPF
jgi:hypothetical protein